MREAISRAKLFFAVVASLIPIRFAVGEAEHDPQVLSACHDIFTEDILKQNVHAVQVAASNRQLTDGFVFLSDWVLPGLDRESFRLTARFSQTNPAPDGAVNAGGRLTSPVFDLIDAAVQLGRLDELRSRVRVVVPASKDVKRQKLALLVLIEFARGEGASAPHLLEEFASLFKPLDRVHPAQSWPEMLVLTRAVEQKESHRLVEELLSEFCPTTNDITGNGTLDVMVDHVLRLKGLYKHDLSQEKKPNPSDQPESLTNWLPTSHWNAESRGSGRPNAAWQLDGNDVCKVAGHDTDYLMYRIPLKGNYQVECDMSISGGVTTAVMVAGTQVDYHWGSVRVGTFHSPMTVVKMRPHLSYVKDWIRFRAKIENGTVTQWMNGKVVYQGQLEDHASPWLALRSGRRNLCRFRNLRITGNPQVPESIRLSDDSRLSGWASYYENGIGAGFDWTPVVQGDQFEIYGRRQYEWEGVPRENLLRYHRPMLEDGEVRYEFYYRNGQTLVHPAMDRCCFILRESGVFIHWLTDRNFDVVGHDPLNEHNDPRDVRLVERVPLDDNAWNTLSMKVAGETVTLVLNGVPVYQRQLDASNQRAPGLFYYAHENDARIRNVTWRGDWPRSVPSVQDQELKGEGTDLPDANRKTLSDVVRYDFREPSSLGEFEVLGQTSALVQKPTGCYVKLSGDAGVRHLSSAVRLRGQFDIEAVFEDLQIRQIKDLTTGIALMLNFDTADGDNCGVYRRFQGINNVGPGNQHRLLFAYKRLNPDGGLVYSGTGVPEESHSGRLRLVRQGNTVYGLYAEDDSPNYRIIGSHKIEPPSAEAVDIRLLLQAPGNSQAEVIWKTLTIHAEEIIGK